MTKDEIRAELASHFGRRTSPKIPPTTGEWSGLENLVGCELPSELVDFHDVVGDFRFEGELLEVAVAGNLMGLDTIATTMSSEGEIPLCQDCCRLLDMLISCGRWRLAT